MIVVGVGRDRRGKDGAFGVGKMVILGMKYK